MTYVFRLCVNNEFHLNLGPDSGWNTIDELPLPYDADALDKQDCIGSNLNDTSSNCTSSIENNDQLLKSSEQMPSLHKNNLSIWKDEENINELSSNHNCNNVNEVEGIINVRHNISFENIVNRKNIKQISFMTPKQYIDDEKHVKCNINSQCSTNSELQLDNSESVEHNMTVETEASINLEKSCQSDTLVNGHLQCVDIKELSNQNNLVQNVLIDNILHINNTEVNSISDLPEMFNNDLSINNNNNIIKNVREEVIETVIPNSVHLRNKTLQEHDEIIEKCPDQIPVTQIKHCEKSENVSITEVEKVEKNVESINSVLQNQQANEVNLENNSDTEFDKFSDFHTFSIVENEPTSVLNDDFCDFESGINDNQFVDVKQSDKLLVSELHVQFDYKEFCKDTFQGDYVSFIKLNIIYCVLLLLLLLVVIN